MDKIFEFIGTVAPALYAGILIAVFFIYFANRSLLSAQKEKEVEESLGKKTTEVLLKVVRYLTNVEPPKA